MGTPRQALWEGVGQMQQRCRRIRKCGGKAGKDKAQAKTTGRRANGKQQGSRVAFFVFSSGSRVRIGADPQKYQGVGDARGVRGNAALVPVGFGP